MENGPYWFVLSHVLFKYELIAIFEYFVLQYKLQSPNNPVLNLNALMTFMTYYVLNPLTLVDNFFLEFELSNLSNYVQVDEQGTSNANVTEVTH